jgi:hypothetical protein
VAQAYARAARPNVNPSFTLLALADGVEVPFDALPAGAEVELRADWSSSPEETFVLIDGLSRELSEQTERYDVSWFVTGGALTTARSSAGVGRWRLPAEVGQGAVWAVLRDSRGGVAVTSASVRWR